MNLPTAAGHPGVWQAHRSKFFARSESGKVAPLFADARRVRLRAVVVQCKLQKGIPQGME
jgi:hypothetical protein